MIADTLDRAALVAWLREEDPARLEALFREADATRARCVGDAVHLRGLVEISNHCVRRCAYCGIRTDRHTLDRYRMRADEVVACAHEAVSFGYGTLVLQAGEDPGLDADMIASVVRRVRTETPLAITLSLGERDDGELALWREAGADRYLLRFETSAPSLYARIHPSRGAQPSDRLAMLGRLRAMGYEVGSGMMIGIPGQCWETLADDLLLCRTLDLDMIGVGPYIPHPDTPLGRADPGLAPLPRALQVPRTELMTYKSIALARLRRPDANIPSTTALATLNIVWGRESGLQRGANVVMPNLTPPHYRERYEIYPDKACVSETASACERCLKTRVELLGRTLGQGPGARGAHLRAGEAAPPGDD